MLHEDQRLSLNDFFLIHQCMINEVDFVDVYEGMLVMAFYLTF